MAEAIPCLKLVFANFFDQIASYSQDTFRADFPQLAQLVNRSEIHDEYDLSIERELLTSFGFVSRLANSVNVTELTSTFDGIDYCAQVVRADPVHLRADGARLRLFAGDGFEPTSRESEALLGELNRQFPDLEFIGGKHAGRWYVKLPHSADFSVPSPLQINQQPIDLHLPSGRDAKRAHVLLNEIQMVLYQSAVNQTREADGVPPINSVWLWGTGELLNENHNPNLAVWGNDVLGAALARRNDVPFFPINGVASVLAKNLLGRPTRLVLINSPTGPLAQRDLELDLPEFERNWIPLIFGKLRIGAIRRLEIIGIRRRLVISTMDSWKFWRRSDYFGQRMSVRIDPAKLGQDVSAHDTFD